MNHCNPLGPLQLIGEALAPRSLWVCLGVREWKCRRKTIKMQYGEVLVGVCLRISPHVAYTSDVCERIIILPTIRSVVVFFLAPKVFCSVCYRIFLFRCSQWTADVHCRNTTQPSGARACCCIRNETTRWCWQLLQQRGAITTLRVQQLHRFSCRQVERREAAQCEYRDIDIPWHLVMLQYDIMIQYMCRAIRIWHNGLNLNSGTSILNAAFKYFMEKWISSFWSFEIFTF